MEVWECRVDGCRCVAWRVVMRLYIAYSEWLWGNKECYGVIESGDGLSDNMKSTYVNNGK